MQQPSDELTGLFNRRGFLTLAEACLLTAQRRQEPVSLAFVDLDRFEHINDTWGHEEGDRALIAIADLMKAASVSPISSPGRVGTNLSFCSPIPARHDAATAMETLSHSVARSSQQAAHLAAGVLLGLRRVRSRQPSQSQRAGGHR